MAMLSANLHWRWLRPILEGETGLDELTLESVEAHFNGLRCDAGVVRKHCSRRPLAFLFIASDACENATTNER